MVNSDGGAVATRKRSGETAGGGEGKRLRVDEEIAPLFARSMTFTRDDDADATPLGCFDRLPREMLLVALRYLDCKSLTRLSCTSKAARDVVEQYVATAAGRRRFNGECVVGAVQRYCIGCHSHHFDYAVPESFARWGRLLKAVTCLYPTKTRIQKMQQFYRSHIKKDQPLSPEVLTGWGELVMAFVELWDFGECVKVYKTIVGLDSGHVLRMLETFQSQGQVGVGSQQRQTEQRLRFFFRNVFLNHDFGDQRDFPFWLSTVVGSCSTAMEQAKLLALLFAPVDRPRKHLIVRWRSLIDVAVTTLQDARRRVEPLARAVRCLRSAPLANGRWTDDALYALVEELTTFPEPWALDNFAAFLLLAPDLLTITLVSRVVNGHVDEAATIMSAMKTLCWRWNLPMKTFSVALHKAVAGLPNGKRSKLLAAFVNNHAVVQVALLQSNSVSSVVEWGEELDSYCAFKTVLRDLRRLVH